MELRVLGAHNMESKETRMESHLIDGVLLLDAGGPTRALTFQEQMGIRAIILSHRHFDHVRDLLPLGGTRRDTDVTLDASIMFADPDALAFLTIVRTDRYKLVAVHGLEAGELYDLEQDPDETHNRWDVEYREVKVSMLSRLCGRMAWTVDPLPVRSKTHPLSLTPRSCQAIRGLPRGHHAKRAHPRPFVYGALKALHFATVNPGSA